LHWLDLNVVISVYGVHRVMLCSEDVFCSSAQWSGTQTKGRQTQGKQALLVFLADRTNGRAIATLLCLSSVVCRRRRRL